MTAQIVHPQRLAWDGALMFVRALASDQVGGWPCDQVGRYLGPEHRQALADSRHRLMTSERPDALQVESGLWRVRLADLLADDPSTATAVRALIDEAAARLAAAADVRPFGPAVRPRVIDLGLR